MRVIAFNFTKVSAEKMNENVSDVKINTEIDIPEIKQIKQNILKIDEEILQLTFLYRVKYEPEMAEIDLRGKILLSVDPKQAKEILKDWKKKKTSDEFKALIFNIIVRKAAPKSMQLEDEMNLPLHLPLPTIKLSKE